MKKLILWDIDGTLITSGGAGERALIAGLKTAFDVNGSLAWIDYSGRTDAWIAHEVLRHYGLPETPQNIQRYLEGYLQALTVEMANPRARLHAGILTLLETLHQRPDVAQGLLTGNLEHGARIKLEHFAVWRYFEFGAYADDSAQRNELGPHALRRARERHGVDFSPERVFIIGDTPRDIECGKIIRAKTIAVATGKYSIEQLRAHEPTAVFSEFSDTAAFLRVIDAA
ncbi:MAG: haloacid dehalogenase-like hydrolase [Verrucomicrobiota bacterium]|nr:haloacid dehalogenase-like hydrolase [Verrucomicrobiota bacterium]